MCGGQMLVVRRPRYNDWSIPKGHVDDGESWGEAAVREVLEETGVESEIVGGPLTVSYPLPRQGATSEEVAHPLIKVVVFYEMRCVGVQGDEPPLIDLSIVDGSEVDRVEWWPVGRAAVELTYEVERNLIADLI
jgi:ADP-ribose pyrophosphatase YjhB (NUDIX family)